MKVCVRQYLKLFLSTPSARRATATDSAFLQDLCISIHALREEGDPRNGHRSSAPLLFLSTPSARRATLSVSVCL